MNISSKQGLVVFVGCALVVGCSTPTSRKSVEPASNSESASHVGEYFAPESLRRAPASISSEATNKFVTSLEGGEYASLFRLPAADYRALAEAFIVRAMKASADDPHKDFGRYMKSMEDIYVQTELALKEFDCLVLNEKSNSCKSVSGLSQRLIQAAAKSPMNDLAYETLLASRVLKESLIEQVAALITGFLYLEHDPDWMSGLRVDGQDRSGAARKIMDDVRTVWGAIGGRTPDKKNNIVYQEGNMLRRLVFQDLAFEVASHLEEFQQSQPTRYTNIDEFIQIANEIVISDPVQFGRAHEAAEIDLRNKRANWRRPGWMAESFRLLDFAPTLQQTAGDRAPNSEMIRPSPDRDGNVTGNTFCKGVWAVTLDDGPHKTHTETIRSAFARNGASGTFFWLARLTPPNRSLVTKVKDDGFNHTLANHSYSHANLPKLGKGDLQREIIQSTDTHEGVYGRKIRFFRCPYGACGPNGSQIRQMIADKGMIHTFWNVDSLDWQDKNPDTILNRVKAQIEKIDQKGVGGVVLFHDIHPQSADATSRLIDWMVQTKKFKLRSMDQVVDNINKGRACD